MYEKYDEIWSYYRIMESSVSFGCNIKLHCNQETNYLLYHLRWNNYCRRIVTLYKPWETQFCSSTHCLLSFQDNLGSFNDNIICTWSRLLNTKKRLTFGRGLEEMSLSQNVFILEFLDSAHHRAERCSN